MSLTHLVNGFGMLVKKSTLKVPRDFIKNVIRFGSSFKAASLEGSGKPFKIVEVKPQKKLKKGQVRIRVQACAFNAYDYLASQGQNPGLVSYPAVLGYEISGDVVETNDCQDVAKGDRVVALNKDTLGGLAQEVVVDQKDVWLMPGNIGYAEAASISDSFGTALLGLVKRGHLTEKQTVLVSMAPSHGYAPLDLAANVYKAKVIAVSIAESETALLRDRGAWSALAYDDKQMKNIVKDLTKSQGVSIIYDTLAGDLLTTSLHCVSQGGHIVIAGYTLNELPPVQILTLLKLPSFSITAVSLWSYRNYAFKEYRQAISEVLEMAEQSLISPNIAAKFKLSDVNKAAELIKGKQPVGKVVILMDQD